MHKTAVSVIIPVYNAMPYLIGTVSALLGQTLQNIEFIFIDDASEDGSYEFLCNVREKDSRVTVIRNDCNDGAAVSRNRGLGLATGEYVFFMDADDLLYTEALKKMYQRAQEIGADVISCDFNIRNEKNGATHMYTIPLWFKKRWNEDECLLNGGNKRYVINMVSHVPWNKLCRTEYVKKSGFFFQNVKSGNDILWGHLIIMNAEICGHVSKDVCPLIEHRINIDGQISANAQRQPESVLLAENELYSYIENHNVTFRAGLFSDMCTKFYFWNIRLSESNKRIFINKVKNCMKKNEWFANWDKNDFYTVTDYEKKEKILANYELNEEEYIRLFRYDYNAVIAELMNRGCKSVLWGCGGTGRIFAEECMRKGYLIEGIVDKRSDPQEKKICGIRLLETKELKKIKYDVIIVTSSEYLFDIIQDIKQKGLEGKVVDITACARYGISFDEAFVEIK